MLGNGTELTGTKDHPLYIKDKGYASYDPAITFEDSDLIVEQIEVGDKAVNLLGDEVEILQILDSGKVEDVYNLDKIEHNHNFYANDVLVHNRFGGPGCCFVEGTEISLANDDVKNIEDVVVGDEVLSYNGKDLVVSKVIATKPTIVGHRNLLTLAGDGICNIEFTPEHPFLTKEGWKSVTPEEEQYGKLEPGDEINCCGAWKKISSIDIIDSTPDKKVYNFTVKEFHSYVANGIIVHNK